VNTRQAYEQAARMLADMCHATHSALLCGDPSPRQQRLFEWMHSPGLGDMVFVDAAGSANDLSHTVGRWTSSWTYLYPPEGDESFRNRAGDVVYEIELLDGSVTSWSDVALLRVPVDRSEWQSVERSRSAFTF
jgi:hypothetical protein